MLAKKDLFLFSGNKRAFAMATLVAAAIANADVAPTSSAGSSGIVDFYFSQPSSGTTVPKVYVDVALIQKEVEAVVNFIPRMKASYECFGLNDDICPVNAVKCGENLEVVDGYSVAVGATTTDYTSKTGSSYTYAAVASTGLIWDDCNSVPSANLSDSVCTQKGMRLPTASETTANGGPVPSCWGISTVRAGSCNRSFPYWNGGTSGCDYPRINYNVAIRCVGTGTTYSCPSGGTLSGSTCTVNTLACPAGYTATTGAETAKGECKKTINYTYYDYKCPTTKVVPSYAAKVTTPANYTATASTGLRWDNCEGRSTAYAAGGGDVCYPYSAEGYCASKGMRLPSLSETTAKGGPVPSCPGGGWTSTRVYYNWAWRNYIWSGTNFAPYEDPNGGAGCPIAVPIRCVANATTYTCPSGGTLSGTTCLKTVTACPAGYTPTTGADTANGECRKDEIVPVDVPYVPKNAGGNCPKADPSKTTDNSTALSSPCNTSTPPAGNCEQRTYSCPAGDAKCKPISSNGTEQWCSPIGCTAESRCEIAQCESSESAAIGATDQQKCLEMVCDANQPYNEFCGKASCPSGYGVYLQGEKCYQDVCPPDSTQLPDGSCQQLQCPTGSTEVNGVCILN